MIKLKIWNYLGELSEKIKNFNEEQLSDGKTYEFNSIKEAGEFIDSIDLEWIDEYKEPWLRFDSWTWPEIDTKIFIDKDEDNGLIFYIDAHMEYRD